MPTVPPTSQFSDAGAALGERSPGADWERDRGERAQLAASPALGKLLVVALMATAIGVGVFAQDQLAYGREQKWGLVYWGIALAFFVAGLGQAWRITRGQTVAAEADNPTQERTISLATEAALFAAVFAFAVFFRFYRIGSIPPGLNHDAAWWGLMGIRITKGISYTPVDACCDPFARETTLMYVIAFFQLFLGYTKFAIELAAISLGLATVGVFYLLLRRLFDIRLALIAAFLLAVSGWDFTFNRVGWPVNLVPLFYALVFYFLVKGVQERRQRDFILAGLLFGFSLDTYDAARIIPFIVGTYLLYEFVRNPRFVRTNYRHLALFGIAALVAFAPLGWYALHHWQEYTGRSRFLWVGSKVQEAGSLEPLFINIKNALLMFNFSATGDDFFVQQPLLDMPVSVFFTLGLVYSLVRVRQRRYFLMVTMLVLTMVIGIAGKPDGNRGLAAVLPTTVFAAVFLFEAWRWLGNAYPHLREGATIGLVAILLFVAWTSFASYLGPDRRDQWGYYPETTRVGRYMHDIAPEYEIHAAAGNWPRNALTYLSYQGHGDPFKWVYTYTDNATELLSIPPAVDKRTAYIIENTTQNQEVVQLLQSRFPSASTDSIYYPDGSQHVIAYSIRVPAGGGAGANLEQPAAIPGAPERDAERRTELKRIVDALTAYHTRTGAYPDSGGNTQTACVYMNLDALCQLISQVGGNKDAFADPSGDPTTYGYWYTSNGTSFTLVGSFEGPVSPEEKCTPEEAARISRLNLACFRGGS